MLFWVSQSIMHVVLCVADVLTQWYSRRRLFVSPALSLYALLIASARLRDDSMVFLSTSIRLSSAHFFVPSAIILSNSPSHPNRIETIALNNWNHSCRDSSATTPEGVGRFLLLGFSNKTHGRRVASCPSTIHACPDLSLPAVRGTVP